MQAQRAGWHPAVDVTLVGLLLTGTAVATVALLQTQRELFLNGLPSAEPMAYPRPDADLAAAATALGRYWPLAAGLLAMYLVLLVVVRQSRTLWAGRFAIVVGIAGHLALLPSKPGLSIDIYSYVAHGYLANQTFTNPYLDAAASAASSAIGPALIAQGWVPVHPQTPYGPLWTHVEALAAGLAGNDVGLTVLLLKAVVTAATIGTGVLAFAVANHVQHGLGPVAAVAWLLNPLVVVEFAVEGHNDALAICFTALALLAALRGWAAVAVTALSLGVLTKYAPAAFGLAVLVMLVRTVRPRGRLLLELLLGAAVSLALGWLLWRRWWTGSETLEGLRLSTTAYPTWSPAGMLASAWTGPYESDPSAVPQLVLSGALLVVVLAASWGRRPAGWLAGCAAIAFAILAISPLYWPWYSALAIAVLAVRSGWPALLGIGILTAGSRIAAPWGDLATLGYVPFDEAARIAAWFGLTLPVTACVVVALVAFLIGRLRPAPRSVPA